MGKVDPADPSRFSHLRRGRHWRRAFVTHAPTNQIGTHSTEADKPFQVRTAALGGKVGEAVIAADMAL